MAFLTPVDVDLDANVFVDLDYRAGFNFPAFYIRRPAPKITGRACAGQKVQVADLDRPLPFHQGGLVHPGCTGVRLVEPDLLFHVSPGAPLAHDGLFREQVLLSRENVLAAPCAERP